MDRYNTSTDAASDSPPSEAWLFAQAILGKPIPDPATKVRSERAERERLEWLAKISSRHADQLRKLRSAEAEARRGRELLEWLAKISTEHESKLCTLLREEAEAKQAQVRYERFNEDYSARFTEWNEPDHPRKPAGPGGGQWVAKGEGGGSSGGSSRSNTPTEPNRAGSREPSPGMLELAHTWWRTKGALEQARRDVKELPFRIASERAQLGSGGRYAYIHTQNLAKAQRELEAAKSLAPQLEKQLGDLERLYRDSGYDEVPYSTWTPGETLIGGMGIEQVGRAVAMGGTPAGLTPTGIEFDVVSAVLAGPAILRLGKAVLGKALGKARIPKPQGASLGQATSSNYRKTFLDANPDHQGNVIVHHGVEQQTLKNYPGVITEQELHSLENLRGIPKGINSETHLRAIRKEWNLFYDQHAFATKEELLDKAAEIDNKYGHLFDPPIR